ncbi:MAG: PH domain-containing protein [Flavobacteriales bacterium]|nr:PH domain-containing protein [Flavobacteriales bacterium]
MNRIVFSILILISSMLYSCNLHEGGVRVYNNMEKHALDYIKQHQLLNEGEIVLAYYDYTISLDGSRAAFITNERLVYHDQETQNTSVRLENITEIQHRKESLIGYIIEVFGEDGNVVVIEIIDGDNGELFLKILKSKVEGAKGS